MGIWARYVLREWVVGGGGLDGYFGDALTISARNSFQKWDGPNGESELATAHAASLLVELECVAA